MRIPQSKITVAGAAYGVRPARPSARPPRPGRARAARCRHRAAGVREDDAARRPGCAGQAGRAPRGSPLMPPTTRRASGQRCSPRSLAVPDLPSDSPLLQVGRRRGDEAGLDVIDELIEALAATAPPIRVVLDDLQELAAPQAMRDLARIIRSAPDRAAARPGQPDGPAAAPAATAARGPAARAAGGGPALRGRGRYDPHARRRSRTDPRQIAVLVARTEGWVAGLRFAALALRSSDDPQGFIARFSGSEESVAGYLTGEVMARLPAPSGELLRVAAVCSELSVALAEALLGAGGRRSGSRRPRPRHRPGAAHRPRDLPHSSPPADLPDHRPGKPPARAVPQVAHHRRALVAGRRRPAPRPAARATGRRTRRAARRSARLRSPADSGGPARGRAAGTGRCGACPAWPPTRGRRFSPPWSPTARRRRPRPPAALEHARRIWPPDPEPALRSSVRVWSCS